MNRWIAAAALALPFTAFGANVVQTGQVRAELIAHAPQGIAPGREFWLGLRLEHIPHWHTYWKNAGDSGLPTTLTWTLPAGVTAGDIDWPTPRQLPIGPLLNFGYEGVTVLPVPVTVSSALAGPLHVKLDADWLVCKIECIPQSGTFELSIPVDRPSTAHAADFERALSARPRAVAGLSADARAADGTLAFTVDGLPPELRGRSARVFPETAGVVDNPAPVEQGWHGELWQARWPISAQRSESPTTFPLVLAFDDGSNLRVVANVTTSWSQVAASVASASATGLSSDVPTRSPPGFVTALLFAFLGGVILNLMPCVFPVLSLKVLALAQHSGSARERGSSALAYTAGVVIAFLVLAGLLIAARAGGEQLGWGFQLQSPGIIVALAALFTLIGLNLAGVFEIGSLLPSSVASLRARDPTLDSFLTGLLAAAVASPCTAPFMGAALGVALTWPVGKSLAVFAALGVGVAAPYLLASAVPAIAGRLPRPGRWMETFRNVLAFPMFATVIWLTWVLGQQVGIDGAAALLVTLLSLAIAAWWWGRRPERTAARLLTTVAIGVLTLGAFAWAAPLWRPVAADTRFTADAGELWQPWSPQRVAELRGAGRKVFVDFTAAWCVTCQYNKRTTLAHAEVLAAFEANKVALLRADWTSRDSVIAAELQRLGRSGVPAYVFYEGAQAPHLLSELPSVDEVRAAVSSASTNKEST